MTQHADYPVADQALARRLERAEGAGNASFIEARTRLDPGSDATWEAFGGTYAMYDGAGSPLTQTFGLGVFDDPAPDVLDAIERFFHGRGSPAFHETSPLAVPELPGILHARGYRPIEQSSVLYRPVGRQAEDLPPRIAIDVVGPDDGEVFADTMVEGWRLDQPAYVDLLRDMARVSLARPDATTFIGRLDGRPAAAGAMSIHEGVMLLAGACTVPAARRQGLQQALLSVRLDRAAERGCDLAMMCALPGSSSQRNAERRGFRIAYTRTKWQRDPDPS